MSEKCDGRVYDGYRHWPCSKEGKYERDGKHYCGIHNPAAAERRAEKSRVKYEARMQAVRERAAENKQMEVDAARYRWIRDPRNECNVEIPNDVAYALPGYAEKLDTAIDAAMAEDRYTLTDLGKAYRAVMQRGAKLNGGVKAGEGGE